ncbi:hypothetical protein [uncultured Microscilla sp.]|uniref:hypothetical protein n=1 Tax=uncultured Microscilla sp. TaxID=432653 RepID=UPI0026321220|nr:hypothetical protein [uncultured Microscilla sp.]
MDDLHNVFPVVGKKLTLALLPKALDLVFDKAHDFSHQLIHRLLQSHQYLFDAGAYIAQAHHAREEVIFSKNQ